MEPQPEHDTWAQESSNQRPPLVPWTTRLRPLSDIREATEPSLIELMPNGFSRAINVAASGIQRSSSLKRSDSQKTIESTQRFYPASTSVLPRNRSQQSLGKRLTEENTKKTDTAITPESGTDRSSAYSLSLENVPRKNPSTKTTSNLRERSIPMLRPLPTGIHNENIAPPALRPTVPHRGLAESPLRNSIVPPREVLPPSRHGRTNHGISTTVDKSDGPDGDVLTNPTTKHPRLSMQMHLSATIFVGGGSIEGCLSIHIDDFDRSRHKRQLTISEIHVELFGIEEISETKSSIFLNLITNVVGSENLPPRTMIESMKPITANDRSWYLMPSRTNIPFLLSLPLDVGPPPFHSKHARIRYLLSGTLAIRDQGRHFLVRTSEPVSVISVLDPERALITLPEPLTVSDEYTHNKVANKVERVSLTAGIHRQV
jgi:hypothetical protein